MEAELIEGILTALLHGGGGGIVVALVIAVIVYRHLDRKLDDHDHKNDKDFGHVRDRLRDISDRLARIEGCLQVKRRE